MATWAPRIALLLPLLIGATALAGENGTRDEAKAMAIRASDLLRNEGPEKAFREFDNGVAFHDRDLYVMVYDPAGKCLAHGANRMLIGKSLIELKDSDGASVIKDIVGVEDEGWVDYKWPRPTTNKIEPKTTYVVRVGNYRIGVGAYK
jgi:cytochrome c